MKMRYHLKSKPDKSGRNKIIFVSVLFIILSLAGFLFPNALRTISFAIARPLWSARLSLTDSLINIKDYFIFQNILILRNKELENELASLKLKEIDYFSGIIKTAIFFLRYFDYRYWTVGWSFQGGQSLSVRQYYYRYSKK